MLTTNILFIDAIESLTVDTAKRLESIPFFQRSLAGELSINEYAAFLIQIHRYVRFTEQGEQALALASGQRAMDDADAAVIERLTHHEVAEEQGHDLLLVEDLACLWHTDMKVARQRLEKAPAAPSVLAWPEVVNGMLENFPEGVAGVALALERMASLYTDQIRTELIAADKIVNIQNAVRFLAAHSSEIDADHAQSGRLRLSHLKTPTERASAIFYAGAGLAMFEGIVWFLNENLGVV